MSLAVHEDAVLFREAIRFTAAQTGFIPRLIEKDYFCSVLLEHLAAIESTLTFKGGTLLAKVHSGFFRLSEDLDFSIGTVANSTRQSRSRSVAPVKAMMDELARRLPVFQIEAALTGSNGSKQYNAAVSYASHLVAQRENIKIEIGVREPVMMQANKAEAATLLLNPVHGRRFCQPFPVQCLPYPEAMAEKLRAALCRREPAIRDFFDIDHAVRSGGLSLVDTPFLDLLRRKLDVEGTGPADVSPEKLERLRRQLDAQLQPVLRSQDFEKFDLDAAFSVIARTARAVQ